jgi:integrase
MRPGSRRTALPGANKIWRSLAEGRVARDWYAWRGKGAPLIARFEGANRGEVIAQENSVEGAKVIAEGFARATHPSIDTRTLGGILDAWEASDAFRRRAESTKRNERGPLKGIRAAVLTMPNGQRTELVKIPARFLSPKSVKAVRRDLRAWLEGVAEKNGPRAADVRRDILSKAINWAKGEGLCEANPAEGIADFSYSDRSDIIWLGDELQRFEAAGRAARRKLLPEDAPEPEEPPPTTLALLLACYSGLRREDLCRLADPHVSEHAIMLKPLKSQRRARTANKKAPADVIIPRTPELDAVLTICLKVRARWEEADKVKRPSILLNSRGMQWTPAGLTSSFIKLRDEAKVVHVYDEPGLEPEPKTLHDARGTFVTHMRCLGYGKEEVAEMVGWETDDVDRVAKRYADANRIALAWLERIKRKASNG